VVSLCHHDGPSFCIPYNKLGLVLRWHHFVFRDHNTVQQTQQ
jgi:hypothetical protein